MGSELVVSGTELTAFQRSFLRPLACNGPRTGKYAFARPDCKRRTGIALFLALLLVCAVSFDCRAETRLLVLGDSLTAGYGLPPEQAFPAQLETRLKKDGYPVTVINAGVSGDTSAGGRARLGWALADRPDLVLVELGANDGLRGLDPGAMKGKLDAIIRTLRGKGIGVMLAGMLAPPNMGPVYEREFNAVFPALAREHDIVFYPFFLDGVAADPALNQRDGIHPNAKGVAAIVDRIAPFVVRLLKRGKGK